MSLDAYITQNEIDAIVTALGAANVSATVLQVNGVGMLTTSMSRAAAYKIFAKLLKANAVFRQVGDSNRVLTTGKLNRLRTGTDADRVKLLEFLSDIAYDADLSTLKQRIFTLAPHAAGWVADYRQLLRIRQRIRTAAQLTQWERSRTSLLNAIADNRSS